MDDLEDLDAFIANIEQSAPQEEFDSDEVRCQECDTNLEQIDGDYICPNCNAKATNILQLEETEVLQHDETGRVAHGQQVRVNRKRGKHVNDYGWAWSTDEAIIHILDLQLNGLEKCGMIGDLFRQGVKNMWIKFWLEYIAPVIKDKYEENDLIPLKIARFMKLRDIEVLIKVQDKVVIARKPAVKANKSRVYKMMSARFVKYPKDQPKPSERFFLDRHKSYNSELVSEETSSSSDTVTDDEGYSDPANRSLVVSTEELNNNVAQVDPVQPDQSNVIDIQDESVPMDTTDDCNQTGDKDYKMGRPHHSTGSSREKIAILTLDRTLAFIEATARCMISANPIFAADIIRACNHRIIPFFGAHKYLPEGMKLNSLDKLMFQKTRPPSPLALTKSASLLLATVYHDRLPFRLPVPDQDRIIERFIYDMNLPYDLFSHVRGQIQFSSFSKTRPLEVHSRNSRSVVIPQYDRWAFAILIAQLKRIFNLSYPFIEKQDRMAKEESSRTRQKIFSMKDWCQQMSARLKLIFHYDPFVLFHPMTDVGKLKMTPSTSAYIDSLLSDRVTTQVRARASPIFLDPVFRADFADFLHQEVPRPQHIAKEILNDEVDRPIDVKSPIRDAFLRTKPYWYPEISKKQKFEELLFEDFNSYKLSPPKLSKKWSIYEGQSNRNYTIEILDQWPYCYKLLLSVGAFICYCEPKDLLTEVRAVEEYLYPSLRIERRLSRAKIREI